MRGKEQQRGTVICDKPRVNSVSEQLGGKSAVSQGYPPQLPQGLGSSLKGNEYSIDSVTDKNVYKKNIVTYMQLF